MNHMMLCTWTLGMNTENGECRITVRNAAGRSHDWTIKGDQPFGWNDLIIASEQLLTALEQDRWLPF